MTRTTAFRGRGERPIQLSNRGEEARLDGLTRLMSIAFDQPVQRFGRRPSIGPSKDSKAQLITIVAPQICLSKVTRPKATRDAIVIRLPYGIELMVMAPRALDC